MQASEGAAVLAGETRMRAMSRKGYYAPSAWDVYWTARKVWLTEFAAISNIYTGHQTSRSCSRSCRCSQPDPWLRE